jgi:hypothetical protein
MLPSQATVTFEPGCVVSALPGAAGQHAYKSPAAVLFTAPKSSNLTILGHGAVWRMQRRQYADLSLYTPAEWRHTLKLQEVNGVTLIGLTLEESGGDGIYVGAGSANVHIEKVKLLRHYRQAMSVIGASNMTVVDSLFGSTGRDGYGTAPAAGLDVEPNSPNTSLVGIRFLNCNFSDNFGSQVQFSLGKLGPSAPPVDIRIEYCRVDGNATALIRQLGTRANTVCASGPKHTGRSHSCTHASCLGSACYSSPSPGWELSSNPGQRGEISIVDVSTTNTLDHGLWIRDVAPDGLRYTFRRSSFSHTALRTNPLHFPNFTSARGTTLLPTPVGVTPMGKHAWGVGGEAVGNVRFQNVSVTDFSSRPWLLAERTRSLGLTGSVQVMNPHGCQVESEGGGSWTGNFSSNLSIVCHTKSM